MENTRAVTYRQRIMVVEDDADIRRLLCEDLSGQGFVCSESGAGGSALRQISNGGCDLLLLDLHLPDISGLAVLAAAHSISPTLPVIILTAVRSPDTVVEAMKLGASDYIVKPFTSDRISRSVQKALEGAASLNELDAIAAGVRIRLDIKTGFSRTVTNETAEIARGMGLPEDKVNEWAAARARSESEPLSVMKTSIARLERSFAAQDLLNLIERYGFASYADGTKN